MTLKDKKREKNASLFRRYEKDRRSRFNALLDKLAALLPNFAECNNGDQKWTKAQIVENAIKLIKTSPNSRNPEAESDKSSIVKLLKKQNKKLREIIRNEFVPEMCEKEFCSLDFVQLQTLIKSKKNETITDAINDAGDVFVVATENRNQDSDHTYSLIVQQEAEVEIGSEIDHNEAAVVILNDHQDQPVTEEEALVDTQQCTVSQQPIIIQMAPQVVASAPNFIRAPAQPPPNKLPLPPRNTPCANLTGLVNVYNNPLTTSQPWRLPKEKRRRKRQKKLAKTNENEEKSAKEPEAVKKSQTKEVVDLTTVDKDTKNDDKTGKKEERKRTNKSSYSIAALCQMSVNIGAENAVIPENISSPGVISINSTDSPRATPTPNQQPKKVIQELKPVAEPKEIQAPTSPTKSYLTQFPVVNKNQQQNQTKKESEKKVQSVEKPKESSKTSVQSQQLCPPPPPPAPVSNPVVPAPVVTVAPPSVAPPTVPSVQPSTGQSRAQSYNVQAQRNDYSHTYQGGHYSSQSYKAPGHHYSSYNKQRMNMVPMQYNEAQQMQHYGSQMTDENFFSVNQLVKAQQLKKNTLGQASKRSSTSSSSRYSKQSRPETTPSSKTENPKKEDRKKTSSSRSSAQKRSYTAESLLSQVNSTQDYASQQVPNRPTNHYHHHHHHSSRSNNVNNEKISQNRMPEINWNDAHFAPFPSISPSPNLFSSQDFGSFDFPVFSEMNTSSRKSQNNSMQTPAQQPPQQDQFTHDGTGHQQLFDANFFSTAGTLTPPTGIYPAQDENYANFNSNLSPQNSRYKSRSSQQQLQAQQQQPMTDQRQMSITNDVQQQHLYSSQQAPGGSSYVNFNLSTIFPEINVPTGPAATDKIAALLPSMPPPLPKSSTSSALPTIPSLPHSASSNQDLLPHSISIFGSHATPTHHQMSFGSFAASTFSTTAASTSVVNHFSLNE